MSKFLDYVNDTLLVESVINDVEVTELSETFEVLCEAEVRLDEFLGLGKLADKLKGASEKADKKVADVKKGAKDFAKEAGEAYGSAKDAVKNAAKETAGKIATDAKEVGKSFKEIGEFAGKTAKEKAEAVKDKFVQVSAQAREGLKKIFSNIKDASEDQKKVLADLAPLFEKIEAGKSVGGAGAISIMAAVLAMDASGATPSYKSYQKQLEKLRTTPMLSSYRFSVKKS